MKCDEILFLANSTHTKPWVVLEGLLESRFMNARKLTVVTNNEAGSLINLLDLHNINRVYIYSNTDLKQMVSQLKPACLVCCGWNKRLPADIISIPGVCLNCHSSVLPDYKGASVFKHYWSNWEGHAGATVHIMNENYDAGNILCTKKIKCFWHDTPCHILHRTSEVTSLLVRQAVLLVEQGDKGSPQKGGRYFYRMTNAKHILYWLYNAAASLLGFPKKHTPHKVIEHS